MNKFINWSNIEHGLFALAFQLPVGFITGYWLWPAIAAVSFFIAREHAQREYQITGGGFVSGLKPWEGFFGWSWDAKMDVAVPAVFVYSVAFIAHAL